VTERFPIVGIGASAGGVEALEAFFQAMPPASSMGFVVVTHLAPNHESWLVDIISRRTAMSVAAAREGDHVEPNHVYVLPPGSILMIENGHLHLLPDRTDHRVRAPIDIFFTSLAEDQGENAVGIVLSGGGSDGTLGIKAIKQHFGLTLAQGTDGAGEPRFKDMPESATATGLVDLVLPVQRMPDQLVSHARAPDLVESDRAAATRVIYAVLRTRLGHDFSDYKDKTFGRRVQRRMQVLQLASIDAYVERLQQDADEAGHLFRDMLIGVTGFFRDPGAFQALETVVVPKLFEGKGADAEVRVWVPGCATGEEVYSIAILLREHMDKLPSLPKVQIFATDIDERATMTARNGLYPANLLKDVSPARLDRCFVAEDQAYRVAKEVRELCLFSTHSVIRDPPFSRLDLVSCRNVLIYLNADLQARLLPIFHYALRRDGFLFLGMAETIARHRDLFAPFDKENRIFRRRDMVTPLPSALLSASFRGSGAAVAARRSSEPGTLNARKLRIASVAVTERFAPAHVVVNEEGEVLHYSVRTGKYLEPASGPPTRDLVAMTRRDLRLDLHAALRKAVETRRSVTNDHVAMEVDGSVQTLSLTVEPITEGNDTAFLVVFSEVGPPSPRHEVVKDGPFPPGADATIRQLERELQESKERLQAIIEELETSNEELKSSNEESQSVNEELQSTNEELESSKEEVQSVNEELHTINDELGRRVKDLARANSDLHNLFASTRVAIIFLDRRMIIRSFTPAASEIFSLIPSDCGRPLTDVASRLDDRHLERDIHETLESQRPIERRVSASRGAAHYLMRLLPYRALDNSVEGVLATFTDISNIVAAEAHQRTLAAELSHRVKNGLTVVASIASQTAARSATLDTFLETFLGRLHALASAHDLLSQSDWSDAPLRELIQRELTPYVELDGGRIAIDGPPVALTPRAALSFVMMIHELATNAAKYGAFSRPDGRVELSWIVTGTDLAQRIELKWIERGGPVIAASAKPGFGTEIIERTASFELGGEAKIAFEKTGLSCTISVPVGPDIVVSQAVAQRGADHGGA